VQDEQQRAAPGRLGVPDRGHADPPLIARGRVAELERGPGVRGLVEGDREEDDGELYREIDDLVCQRAQYTGRIGAGALSARRARGPSAGRGGTRPAPPSRPSPPRTSGTSRR